MWAFLPVELWARVKSGENSAIEEAAERLDGVALYDHVFVPPEGWGTVVAVDVQSLSDAGVIKMVTLHRNIH